MSTIKTSHLEIRPSKTAGKGLFATKAIKKGEIVWLRTRPLLAELKTECRATYCANCFVGPTEAALRAYNPDDPFVTACTGCRKVRYCSKNCQREAWKRSHKYECKILSMPGLPDLLPECRAAILLHYLIYSPSTSESDKNGLKALCSTYDVMNKDFKKGSDVGNVGAVNTSNDIVNRITKHEDTETGESSGSKILNPYFAQILNNALEIPHSASMVDIGIAVDPIACAANHSCAPNALVGFDGPAIYIQAETAIAASEEILFSYCDRNDVLEQRQAILKNRYYFDCKCSKCIEEKARIQTPGYDRSSEALSLRVSNLLKSRGEGISNFSNEGRKTYCSDIEKAMAEMRDAGWSASSPIYAYARDNLIAALSYTSRVLDLLRHAIKRHVDIDPVIYPDKSWVRQGHAWELVQITRRVQTQRTDAEVLALLRTGFDFVPPLWRIHERLAESLKETECRDAFFYVVDQDLDFMRAGIEGAGFAALRAVKEDRDGHCDRFVKLKDDLKV